LTNPFQLAFQELFYGSGMWLGILIILSFVVGLSLKNKYASILCLPVTIFLGIDYIVNMTTQTHLWGSLIMFFTSIFLIINLMMKKEP